MMTDLRDYSSLEAHLYDLKDKCETWHKPQASSFLNEEEQAAMQKIFVPSGKIRYDGGYEGAQKKKVIFLADEENDFSDIICLRSEIDQRFRKISHRDILGALMHLQIDRHSFGDFWIEDKYIYLYTSEMMGRFLIDNLIRINQLSVTFEVSEEHPVQQFHTEKISCVAASERMDAIVAALSHLSRSEAKKMIRQGLVQVNHVTLEEADELCNNNVTISIRGIGRFVYLGISRKTRNGRIVAEFLKSV